MNSDKKRTYNSIALICGLWFAATGWIWSYLACLFVSYPVALVGLFFWYKGRGDNKSAGLNRMTLLSLIAGLVASLVSLFLYK